MIMNCLLPFFGEGRIEIEYAFADELNAVAESYQLVINNRKADAKRKKNERKGLKLLPVINN